MLKEAPPRKGFLEHADYQKLRQELPEHLRPVLAMGYHTGMRLGEILKLRWMNMDFASAEIHLDPGTTKNDEPRTIPVPAELLEMLRIERAKPRGRIRFHARGRAHRHFPQSGEFRLCARGPWHFYLPYLPCSG